MQALETADPAAPDPAWQACDALRRRAPIVLALPDPCGGDLIASLLLAVGAMPAVPRAEGELDDLLATADAAALGAQAMQGLTMDAAATAARRAVEQGKPWVLDPTGAALTEPRRAAAQRLSSLQPAVIRGNGAEILALGSRLAPAFDCRIDSAEALDAAHDLAKATGAVVVVSGAVDYVTDGQRVTAVARGHPVMAAVPALGRALSHVIAAFCTVQADAMAAATDALTLLGQAGEVAAEFSEGPASFRLRLIDRLYAMTQAGA